MKAVVFLSLICACAALPQIFIADTPDVMAEKQRFYQLYNAAAKAAADAPDINVYPRNQVHQTYKPQPQPQTFHVPQTNIQHRFGHSQQLHQAPQYTPKWTGPVAATIPAGLPGSTAQVPNTPEVAAAIAEFANAYNRAVVATRSAAPRPNTYQTQHKQYHAPQTAHRFTAPVAQQRWTGPFAAEVPAGLPGSGPQVADTADVAAAKAHFSRAFQQQLMSVLG